MIRHYEGILGTFDYNDEEFKLITVGPTYLHYCGKGLSVDLPKGCVSTRYMFSYCELPEGFTLGDKFDTSNVTNMSGMFYNCKLPAGFSLGGKFDTSSVVYMRHMFRNCKLPDGFSLGEKFDTSNVTDMSGMFSLCRMKGAFSLGDHFHTGSVEDMDSMFAGCIIERGILLNIFSIPDGCITNDMFKGCVYGEYPIQDCLYETEPNKIIELLKLDDGFAAMNLF